MTTQLITTQDLNNLIAICEQANPLPRTSSRPQRPLSKFYKYLNPTTGYRLLVSIDMSHCTVRFTIKSSSQDIYSTFSEECRTIGDLELCMDVISHYIVKG